MSQPWNPPPSVRPNRASLNQYNPPPPLMDQSGPPYPTNHRHTSGHTYAAPVLSMPVPSLPNSLIPGGMRPRAKSSTSAGDLFFETKPAVPPPPVPHYRTRAERSPPLNALPGSSNGRGYPFPAPSVPPIHERGPAHRSQSAPAPPARPPKNFDQNGAPPIPPLPPKIPFYHASIPYAQTPTQQPPPPAPTIITQPQYKPPVKSHSQPSPQSAWHSPPQSPPLLPKPTAPSPMIVQQVSSSQQIPRVELTPDSPPAVVDEQDELARVLEMSAQESKEQISKFAEQEDEDMARALQESLEQSSSYFTSSPNFTPSPNIPTVDVTAVDDVPPHHFVDSPQFSASDLKESPSFSPGAITPDSSSQRGSWSMPTPNLVGPSRWPLDHHASQMAEDEALARRLAAGDDEEPPVNEPSPTTSVTEDLEPEPPLYQQSFSNADAGSSLTIPTPSDPMAPMTPLGRASSASAVSVASAPLVHASSLYGRSYSFGAGSAASSKAPSIVSSPVLASVAPSDSAIVEEEPPTPVAVTPEPPAPNQFVDKELINGVSFGFIPPQISNIVTMLRGSIPNVVSLPVGKTPPFHIQAPNWRQLLKLMARLSGTRIEASLEAMAATKQELKLRTVVQFIKVHQSSTDWRTILYLTIDDTPPSTATAGWKYTNGDVNTLPWSYTQIQLPPLLQGPSDTAISKYYTIPATSATPHPVLPINFPNMAMYLASAMEDSRRATHDGSSGMRRLAKMVDAFYPADEPGMEGNEHAGRGGVRGVFGKMFGKKSGAKRNEDTWDLVTPFVPDYE